jgi:predicted enzyme related to lactoylglutathione lyase
MSKINSTLAAAALAVLLAPGAARAQPVGRITGLAGVSVASKNPQELAAWYRDVLGITLEHWGGVSFRYDAPGHPPIVLWNAMPTNSEELAPSKRDFMINFAVDDLGAFIERLRKKGVKVLGRDDSDPFGKFAWIIDPDGTKIELWQPKAK